MKKFIISLILILGITPAFAEFISTGNFNNNYNNGFQSRLKMNQPKTYYSTHKTQNNVLQRYNRHRKPCPQCHPHRRYNPYRYQGDQNIPNNNLNALEKHALNKTYTRENDISRLERLENLAFGATQYGDLESRYRNVENAILSRPQYNVKRSIIGNIANYFAGQPTGLSPSFSPTMTQFGGYSNFNPTPRYSNNNFEQYSNGIFGGGWGISGHDYGSGSSIRILD